MGIDYNYDSPTDFKLIFSNRLRLDDSAFQFSDLFGHTTNSATSTNFNSLIWSNWNTHKNSVLDFTTSALNTARNAVVSGNNQEIIIDNTGMRGRQKTSSGNYSDKQFWMINNILAFTDDNWATAKLALGEILDSGSNPGSGKYGLIADPVYGRLLAGQNLLIENEDLTFQVSGSGAFIKNGILELSKNDGRAR